MEGEQATVSQGSLVFAHRNKCHHKPQEAQKPTYKNVMYTRHVMYKYYKEIFYLQCGWISM